MNCILKYPFKKVVLIVESIKYLSPCPKDVGKLSNFVKYCVCFLSWLFVLIFWVLLWCISLCWLEFLIGCCQGACATSRYTMWFSIVYLVLIRLCAVHCQMCTHSAWGKNGAASMSFINVSDSHGLKQSNSSKGEEYDHFAEWNDISLVSLSILSARRDKRGRN